MTLGVTLTDEILRNGVPHTVTTSLVTHNAVLPQNIFIHDEASPLGDPGVGGEAPMSTDPETFSAIQKTPSHPALETAPLYPASSDKVKAANSLTAAKSHIRDNIQALKNLAQSDNWQSIAMDKFNANVQEVESEKTVHDNHQNANERSVEENFQNLGASKSIQENKLFLEKKSIKSNKQLISESTNERASANLASQTENKPGGLNSKKTASQSGEVPDSNNSPKNKTFPSQDNEFQMRVKKLKSHVRNVDSSLQNLDHDK